MIRNLKVLGLLAVAALAISALAASAAQAEVGEPGTFTAGLTPSTHTHTEIHGEQYGTHEDNFFSSAAGVLSCENQHVTYTGTSKTGEDTELSIAPSYGGCRTLEEGKTGLPVKVETHECEYQFKRPKTIEGGQYTGTAGLECPEGVAGIDVRVYLFGSPPPTGTPSVEVCHVTVEPFKELGHIVYTNQKDAYEPTEDGEKYDDITVEATVEKIPYTISGTCHETETREDAVFKSKVTVIGGTEENHHDLWISDGTTG